MPRTLDPAKAQDMIGRAVAALAGDEAAKKTSPAVDAVMQFAKQTVAVGSGGKREPVITSIKTTVRGGSSKDGGTPVTVIYDERKPIDAGPTKRTPIRVGGGTCVTVPVAVGQMVVWVTICVEWQSS
jgi:hypothetical protein